MRRKAYFGAVCFCALLSMGNTQGLADTPAAPETAAQAEAAADAGADSGARVQDGAQIETVIEQYETAHDFSGQPADAPADQGGSGTDGQIAGSGMPGETAQPDGGDPAGSAQGAQASGGGNDAGTADTEASVAERILLEEPQEEETQEETQEEARDEDADSSWNADASYIGSPQDPVNEIYAFLRDEIGFNHAAAVGVLANIKMESDYNANAVGDSGSSYGLCQWHNERYSMLVNFCNGNGLDYSSVHGQMRYLQHELPSYQGVVNYLYGVPDSPQGAYDAAAYWCKYFEAPSNMQARAAERGDYAMGSLYGQAFYYPVAPETEAETEMDISEAVAGIRSSMEDGAQADAAEDTGGDAADASQSVEEEAPEDISEAVASIRSSMEGETQDSAAETEAQDTVLDTETEGPAPETEAQDDVPETETRDDAPETETLEGDPETEAQDGAAGEDGTDADVSGSYIDAILSIRGV